MERVVGRVHTLAHSSGTVSDVDASARKANWIPGAWHLTLRTFRRTFERPRMTSRRQLLLALLALAATGLGRTVAAQADYPQRLIKIVVGNAAGGNDDTISRFVAERLTKEFGQPVIVENRVGGSTS